MMIKKLFKILLVLIMLASGIVNLACIPISYNWQYNLIMGLISLILSYEMNQELIEEDENGKINDFDETF